MIISINEEKYHVIKFNIPQQTRNKTESIAMNIFISDIMKVSPFKLIDRYQRSLARKIRHNKDIKYIGIGREKVKLSLFADNLSMDVENLKTI